MGGDGGSIPGRADIVRTAGYRFVRNLGGMGYTPNTQVRAGSDRYMRTEEKHLRWTTCALTQEPLKPPLSACRLGQLYNREDFISRFLHRKTVPLPPNMSHIQSRRDVRDLNVEFDEKTGSLVCSVTKVEFDAGVKGVVLWSCGCVISSKALETLVQNGEAKNSRQCPVCNVKYCPSEDIVQLVPDIEKVPDLKAAILKQQQTEKQEKKLKKEAKSSKKEDTEKTVGDEIPTIKDAPSELKKLTCESAVSSTKLKEKRSHSTMDYFAAPQTDNNLAVKKMRVSDEAYQEMTTKSNAVRSLVHLGNHPSIR